MTDEVLDEISDAIWNTLKSKAKLHVVTNADHKALVGLMRLIAADLDRGCVEREEEEELALALKRASMDAAKKLTATKGEAVSGILDMVGYQNAIHSFTYAELREVVQIVEKSVVKATHEWEDAQDEIQGSA